MSDKVWMSGVFSNFEIGQRLGTRTKMYGREWDTATEAVPVASNDEISNLRKYTQGFHLKREFFPEADAVFNEKSFKRVGELFVSAGFFVVRGKIAETLLSFNLGEGGLIPFAIYKADLVTPYPGEFFLLNFGCRKDTALPEQSRNLVIRGVQKNTGIELFRVNSWSQDGDIALNWKAQVGPDLWFEERIDNKIFLSNALAQELISIGMKDVFRLKECRIAGDSL